MIILKIFLGDGRLGRGGMGRGGQQILFIL